MNNQNIVSEISLSYSKIEREKIIVSDNKKAVEVFRSVWYKDLMNIQEQFYAMFLSQSNEVLGIRCLNTGTTNHCAVDFKILFGIACKSLSSGIIVAHNHPSGNLKPSSSDKKMTKDLKKAGEILGIRILDSLILTKEDSVSI